MARPTNSIVILLDQMRLGGAERALINLANGFLQEGISVDFLVRDAGQMAEDLGLSDCVSLSLLKPVGALRARYYLSKKLPHVAAAHPALLFRPKAMPKAMLLLPSVAEYLRKHNPKAILTTMPHNNVLALMSRKIANTDTRVVIREANLFSRSIIEVRKRSKGTIMKMASHWYPQADEIVAVCDGVADDLSESLGVPRHRITTVYNPLPLDSIDELAKAEPQHPWLVDNSVPLIVTVGRLTPQKDHATLLRAVSRLNQARACRLIIIGEGGQRSRLEGLISSLGLEKSVQLIGNTSNPFSYVARSNVFVLSSAWEGFPNVLLEALACRTPIVSTDADGGGPAELLQGGRFGRLVPVGAPEQLASAIREALADPGDVQSGRRHVQAFTIERACKLYAGLMLPANIELEPKQHR